MSITGYTSHLLHGMFYLIDIKLGITYTCGFNVSFAGHFPFHTNLSDAYQGVVFKQIRGLMVGIKSSGHETSTML